MIIAITGGYCTGKTEVARIFRKFGAKIIDLDELAHKALNKSYRKIIKEFGKDILIKNRINRHKLAQKVFANKKMLAKLNSIIHPFVIKQMLGLIQEFKKRYKIIAVEAPLLFEAGIKNYFDSIVVVKTNKKTQINRAKKKTGLSKIDILKRINSQWPLGKKINEADFVLDNNGSIEKTRRQTKEICENLINSLPR